MDKLVLIDGHSIMNPGILPGYRTLRIRRVHTNAVYGF